MGHGSISTELQLRKDDLKHFLRPKYVKGMTRSDVPYGRSLLDLDPLHGQEILVIVARFRHRIDGSAVLLSNSWEALTYDLAAVQGSVGTAPLRVDGVTTHHFDRWMNRKKNANDAASHLFVLGPGELVRGIDLCWKDRVIVGLRLHSNQRQSQWFGRREGVIKTVTAPQGYFVNALRLLLPKATESELGIRLCPTLEHCSRGIAVGLMAPDKSARVGKPQCNGDGVLTEFAELHEQIRALVVTCGSGTRSAITNLFVLSPELFNRHLSKREEPLAQGEHVFFLRYGEHLVEVLVVADDRVRALRFRTNLCTSPWYGSPGSSKPTSLTPSDANMQICGFHGALGEACLGSLGVFYHPLAPPGDRAVLKQASSSVSMTPS